MVSYKTKVIESIQGNLGLNKDGASHSSEIPLDQLPSEAIDAVKKMANDHWNKWFDEKIPALNGKTPKQASKSKEGRELLEALLNSYEHNSKGAGEGTTNLFQPDIKQLRVKLGMD